MNLALECVFSSNRVDDSKLVNIGNSGSRCKMKECQIMNSGTSRRVSTVLVAIISFFSLAGTLRAIETTASVEGFVTKVDRGAKTVMVKAADGTEHTMHLVGRTVVDR